MSRMATLARHWNVLRVSWREQNEARARAKPRSEHEFLPAAQEIIEKPPSPGLRWLLLLTCGFFVIALAWSFIGRVDVVAVAAGKTVPAGSAKIIQPIEIGAVRAIHVRNGQFVRAGELLVELDPTLATADEAQSTQTLATARILQARNDALLAHLDGRSSRFEAPPATPEIVARTERALVGAAIGEFDGEMRSLRQKRAEKVAEYAGARAQIAKLREAIPFIEKQMVARTQLADKGYFSTLKLLEYEQARAEHMREIDVQTANGQRAFASIAEIDAQMTRLRGSFGKSAANALAEASDRAGLAGEELRKTERRRSFQQLRSPVDGVVQQVAIATIGGVVQPAQPLMVIVPCSAALRGKPADCASLLEVETMVQNRDIGFVRPGQRVAVKIEAFNFTDYGLIDGVVEWISRDAIDTGRGGGAAAGEGGAKASEGAQGGGLVYAARVRLLCAPSDPRRSPLCDRVQPGMAAQAEIKTGTRRIIQYLLSPLAKSVSEAGRER